MRVVWETTYQPGSWPQPRRVLMKAEVLPKGPNTRFVVTTQTGPHEQVLGWYNDRGASENWTEDLKRGCFADRRNCHRFLTRQFRLLLRAAAYRLLHTLRRRLRRIGVARMKLAMLCSPLINIGGWVREQQDRFQ